MVRALPHIITGLLLVTAAAPAMAQVGAGVSDQASTSTSTPAPAAGVGAPAVGSVQPREPVDTSYILGPGDVLDIGLVGRGDFAARPRVGTDGMILLPYIGKIQASKRTVLELSEDIRKALISGGYFSEAIVRAEVIGISSRYVTVLGFVGAPGLVTLDRAYRLSEILARVGGRNSAGANYLLLTPVAGGPPRKYLIDDLASGAPDKDPVVAAGDKIFIPSGEGEVAYLSGQIKSPGAFSLTPGMTIRMAIAKGGGVTENGSDKKLTVFRAGAKVPKAKLEDPVQVGDVITIGERLF